MTLAELERIVAESGKIDFIELSVPDYRDIVKELDACSRCIPIGNTIVIQSAYGQIEVRIEKR